jgi:hypothetical protein
MSKLLSSAYSPDLSGKLLPTAIIESMESRVQRPHDGASVSRENFGRIDSQHPWTHTPARSWGRGAAIDE